MIRRDHDFFQPTAWMVKSRENHRMYMASLIQSVQLYFEVDAFLTRQMKSSLIVKKRVVELQFQKSLLYSYEFVGILYQSNDSQIKVDSNGDKAIRIKLILKFSYFLSEIMPRRRYDGC